MTNIKPPDDIPPSWESRFLGRYRDCVEEEVGDFEENQEESYRDDLEQNIREDKRHRELLNLCIFPFVEFQPLGYDFIQADPLAELGEPNFDFLLFDFAGHAIFGEVKGSVGEGYSSNYVREVLEQIDKVEEYEDFIVENYTGEPIQHYEFVLAVHSHNADDITQAIISERANVVTWGVHQMEKEISVNTAPPTPDDWVEEPEELYSLLRHDHSELNSEIERYSSSTECFDHFPKSHPVTKMRTIITARHKEKGHCYVDEEKLWATIEGDLFYLNEERKQETLDSIIGLASSIGFLRERDGDEGDFKIVSRYTHSDGLEKTLKRKWIDSKVDERKEALKDECWETIRQDIISETAAQTSLEDFT